MPLIEPAHIVSLPKGQAFSFQEGGQLWKVRMPLPKPAPDDAMPANLQELAQHMRARYNDNAGQWWRASGSGPTEDFDPERGLNSGMPADAKQE
ncbi:hypothetical protein D3C84_1016890 [compost metagenome]